MPQRAPSQNIRLTLAYEGTAYTGWQNTGNGHSIEETLSSVLHTLLQHPVSLQAASRTDAGVHAKGQVVNFFSTTTLPLNKLQHRLNQLLPKDIVASSLSYAPPSFHPTLDALKKEYHYLLCSSPLQLPFHRAISWHYPRPLHVEAMQQAAQLLLGSHDFSAFCNERALWDRNPICHLETLQVLPLPSQRFLFRLVADHFLYKMARNLIGTLVYIGCGKLQAEDIPTLLSSQNRSLCGITAPAHGLRLQTVFYPQTCS